MSEWKFKTLRHMETVRNYLATVIRELMNRQEQHDQTKLEEFEGDAFAKYTAKLRGCTYGSDEYNQFLKEMKPALEHHYGTYRHHPEHFNAYRCCMCKEFCSYEDGLKPPNNGSNRYCPKCGRGSIVYESQLEKCSGIFAMNLIDLIEMFCDWKAAGLRHADGDIYKSIEINSKRFGISDELKQVLTNTADWINMQEVYHKAHES